MKEGAEQEGDAGAVGDRMCAIFDACTADDTPRGRRDAALVSVLFGAGVPRAVALALPLAAYDPASGVLAWRLPDADGRAGSGDGVRRRRAVEGARRALAAWLRDRGEEPGPLITRIDGDGRPTRARLAPPDVDRVLDARARRAGVRTWSSDAFRRHYDSPWWREASRRGTDGRAEAGPAGREL